jgi:hypothetical protein
MGLTSLPREPSLDCDRYRVVKGPVCDRARGYKTLPGAFIPLRLRSMEHPHPILPLQRFVLDPCPPVEAIRFVLCSCLCVCVYVCVCVYRVLHVRSFVFFMFCMLFVFFMFFLSPLIPCHESVKIWPTLGVTPYQLL